MIGKGDQSSLSARWKFTNSRGNRGAHFAIRVRIESVGDSQLFEFFANFFAARGQDYYDRFHAALLQIIDATFDDRFVSEGKQGFESPHPARLSGGEENC